MKKLLTAALATAMVATCVLSLASCKKPVKVDDEATAQNAINYIKGLYDKTDLYETAGSYAVLGKTSVDKTLYDVSWSVSTESTTVNDITDYIKVGTEMDEDYLITVTVTRPTVDVEYTLTASVTVGKVTKTYDFARLLKGLDKVYTVSELLALSENTDKFIDVKSGNYTNKYYSTDGVSADVVVVKGYVVDPGEFNSNYTNYSNIYIVDEYSADKDKNSEGALQVYRIQPDGVYLKNDGVLLQKGDLVTFQGCAQLYKSAIELTYCGDVDVNVIALERDTSDAGKVAAAQAAVTLAATYTAGDITLPAESCGANLEWTVKTGASVATISGSTLTLTEPEADTTVVLNVKISSGTVSVDKEITITVVPTTTKGTIDDPYTIAEVKAFTLDKGAYYSVNGEAKAVYIKGYVVDPGSWSSQYSNYTGVYLVDTFALDKNSSSSDAIQLYSLGGDDQYITGPNTLGKGDCITVLGYIQNYSGTVQISYNGSNNPTAVAKIEASAEVKVACALNAIAATLNSVDKVGEVTLPVSTVNGVDLTWSTENTTYTVTDNKLNVESLPEEETTVTLTVEASCGSVKDTKTVTIAIEAALPEDAVSATLDFVGNYSTYATEANGWTTSYTAHELAFSAVGATELSGTVEFTRANAQDSNQAIADRPVIAVNNSTEYVTVKLDGYVSKVTFDLKQWNSKTFADIHIEYYNGTEWVTSGTTITTPGELKSATLPADVSQVRLSCTTTATSNTQVGLTSITLVGTAYSDEEKIAAAKDAISFAEQYNEGEITIPLNVSGATLAWSVTAGAEVASISGNKVVLSKPDTNTQVTLSVTISCGEATPVTETYTFTVVAPAKDVTGTYNIVIDFANATDTAVKGTKLYFTGALDGDYGATSSQAIQAAKVVVAERANGGYTIAIGAKYIELDSAHHITFVETPTAGWIYNYELNVFTWDVSGTIYYLGTYTNKGSTYTTISASTIDRISGDSASTVGVTQFPIIFETPYEANDADRVAAAKEDLEAKFVEQYKECEITLPAESCGAELTWAVTAGSEVAAISGNTLTLTAPAADTPVTLTVTITCGDVTETKTISFTVIPTVATNYGSLEAPISVSAALAIAEEECPNNGDFTKQVVYMTGVVTKAPTSNGSYYMNLYLGDVNDSSKTVLVYRVNLETNVAVPAEHDTLVIYGYIKNYTSNGNVTIEFDTNGTTYVYAASNVRGTSTVTLGSHDGATVANLTEGELTNGTEITFTVTAETGYAIVSVGLNGNAIEGNEGSYTITVAGDTIVTVTTKSDVQIDNETVLLTLDGTTFTSNTGANSYAGFAGNHEVGDYTVNLTQTMPQTPTGYNAKVIQMQKDAGIVAVSGTFTKIEIQVVSTYAYASCNGIPSVTVGTDKLTAVLKSTVATGIKNGNYEYNIYTLEYTVSGTGSQEVKITAGSATTTLPSIKFYGVGAEGGDTVTDAEKVAAAKEKLTLNATYEAGEVTLPTVDGVTLDWTVTTGSEVASINDNKLILTNPAEADSPVAVALKVTITSGDVVDDTTIINLTVTYSAPVNYGTEGVPISVTEALAVADKECKVKDALTQQVVYMTGKLTNVPTDKGTYYQNLVLADLNDSSKTIDVYSTSLRENVAAPAQNDILVICGYIKNYEGSKIQFSTANDTYVYVESNTRGNSTVTLTENADVTVEGLPEAAVENGTEVTFTVTVIDSKEISAVNVGGVAITATEGTYKFTVVGNMTVTITTKAKGETTTTASVTISAYASKQGWTSTGTYQETVQIDNNITVTALKAGNNGKYYTDGTWRMYSSDKGTFTITAAQGTIVTVKITYSQGGTISANSASYSTGDVIQVNDSSITIAVTSGQARITAIEVVYTA